MSGNPANTNIPPQTSRMYDAGGSLTTIDKVVNDYVTTPMTISQNNATATLTQAAVAGKSWYITYLTWRITGGNTLNDVTIQVLDGSTVIYNSLISKQQSAGTFSSIEFSSPIKITAGNAITYTAGASGTSGTTITLNMGLFNK